MPNEYSAIEQPDPIHNDKPACWDLVMQDMKDRDTWGRSKYGTPLQPFNKRNAPVDFYQEILDATVYCRQMIEENKVIKAKVNEVVALSQTPGKTWYDVEAGLLELQRLVEAR